ncbi:hypothetical protein FA95DRAFT_1563807 [Auriscalpium vulgare]|uniref:Uncharacterized protein n=1 Tax=Auriscalpium vulgare TaxID=40419 RepID=A0ACB8RGV9_9AGAM|nr:hypothetical protein FA95DRAFT_1563807 [Auriscalpium vulgare]
MAHAGRATRIGQASGVRQIRRPLEALSRPYGTVPRCGTVVRRRGEASAARSPSARDCQAGAHRYRHRPAKLSVP